MKAVRMPPLSSLAVDVAAALFRYTIGDVAAMSEEALLFQVDVGRFKDKLLAFAKRAIETAGRYFGLLGGGFATRYCGVKQVQELAQSAAEDPEELIRHVSHLEVQATGSALKIRWGFPPYIGAESAPPIVASVEFMEGAKTWPAVQLVAHGSGKKKKVGEGYVREVEISCQVLGAIALGMGAAYVSGSQSPNVGAIRLLIPLTLVEYDVGSSFRAFLEGIRCDLPEHLLRLIAASYGEKPAVYKYVHLAYRGGKEVEKDKSYEILLDTASLRGASLILRDYRSALKELATRWCECERGRWVDEVCREVEAASEAYRRLYLFLEGGFPDEAYKALSAAVRLKQLAAPRDALIEIAERTI